MIRIRHGISCLAITLVTGCTTGGLDVPTGLKMAVPRASAYDATRAKFAGAIEPGTVTGASGLLSYVSDTDFADAVKELLAINGLLAVNATAARYRVDVTVDFSHSGMFEKEFDTSARYRLITLDSNAPIFDRVLQASDTKTSALYENGGPIAALLLTKPQEAQADWKAAQYASVRNSIASFFGALAQDATLPSQKDAGP